MRRHIGGFRPLAHAVVAAKVVGVDQQVPPFPGRIIPAVLVPQSPPRSTRGLPRPPHRPQSASLRTYQERVRNTDNQRISD